MRFDVRPTEEVNELSTQVQLLHTRIASGFWRVTGLLLQERAFPSC